MSCVYFFVDKLFIKTIKDSCTFNLCEVWSLCSAHWFAPGLGGNHCCPQWSVCVNVNHWGQTGDFLTVKSQSYICWRRYVDCRVTDLLFTSLFFSQYYYIFVTNIKYKQNGWEILLITCLGELLYSQHICYLQVAEKECQSHRNKQHKNKTRLTQGI